MMKVKSSRRTYIGLIRRSNTYRPRNQEYWAVYALFALAGDVRIPPQAPLNFAFMLNEGLTEMVDRARATDVEKHANVLVGE
jgi:hypothetical protein